ncbi:hypothetical protein TVNIR_0357 [Thioalkalivibrio nitratireducens DSM 14787]|uniref:Uncharacterized protein n=1 Tax=Thioalkalivibrio nitratireducens (strain DSM 14787 / UNIQEM 213 / ALEN2) TaxID=1255043 RepID=L0DSV4_THIND|nr:hypothetical protein TVNIR_0357 [Thioalkalivibrio nitratireducens DSM 14787]
MTPDAGVETEDDALREPRGRPAARPGAHSINRLRTPRPFLRGAPEPLRACSMHGQRRVAGLRSGPGAAPKPPAGCGDACAPEGERIRLSALPLILD